VPGTPVPGETPVAPAPGTPIAGGTPVSQPGGPALTKLVDRPFALPGDTITWTIVVSNPNPFDLTNITVTDSVPGELIIINATSSAGSVSVNGQNISLTLGTLAANSTVTITLTTRVRDGVVGVAIVNVAVLGDLRASATTVVIAGLPRTGETPWWRLPLLIGIGGVALAGYGARRRRRVGEMP
ncbi:MAG: DUF11 domain-containing protein, partial [Anaerolineae bacterium]|nr:DUF11 domain-containing protein [Anaerolineae bacterium]